LLVGLASDLPARCGDEPAMGRAVAEGGDVMGRTLLRGIADLSAVTT
jgi:hypothetical protein